MSEPNNQTADEELTTLRKTVSELVTKANTRKARITELETANADLTVKLTASEKNVYELTVGIPVRDMAESLSKTPDLFLEQFGKQYNVAIKDGTLTWTTKDGKPVIDAKGQPVAFEREAIAKHLTSGNDVAAKNFQAITIVSRSTGGGGRVTTQSQPKAEKQTQPLASAFGLR